MIDNVKKILNLPIIVAFMPLLKIIISEALFLVYCVFVLFNFFCAPSFCFILGKEGSGYLYLLFLLVVSIIVGICLALILAGIGTIIRHLDAIEFPKNHIFVPVWILFITLVVSVIYFIFATFEFAANRGMQFISH